MRRWVSAALIAGALALSAITPAFAASTEYTCNATTKVTEGSTLVYSASATFESYYNLTSSYSRTYSYEGSLYTVTVTVTCAPGS
jgi:hypothetical protein